VDKNVQNKCKPSAGKCLDYTMISFSQYMFSVGANTAVLLHRINGNVK